MQQITKEILKVIHQRCKETALALFFILWTFAIAWADYHDQASTDKDFLIFLALMGIINGLIGYIYVTGINRMEGYHKEFREDLKRLDEVKLDKEYHRGICPVDAKKAKI